MNGAVYRSGVFALLNLELDQASERRLAEEAIRLGMTAEHYAALLLRRALTPGADMPGPALGPISDDWERALDGLIADLDQSAPPISDDALRREHLYEDRS